MRLSELAHWSQGQLLGADIEVGSLVIDSRRVQPNDVFLALKGDRFDGHNFIDAALAAGAAAVIVEQPMAQLEHQIEVTDSRKALGLIAKQWCLQFPLKRLAITGNAGKTSVKEMVAALLGDDALATDGNLNNDIGVPLTLLRVSSAHRFGVFELGANHAGEIAWTASLAQPDVVLITNVTGAHLEGFGSMQGIANAKAEIFDSAKAGAVAVINLDDDFADFFRHKAEQNQLRIVSVSCQQQADFSASNYRPSASGSEFQLQHHNNNYAVTLSLPGEHQVSNALQAIAAVDALGVDVVSRLHRLAALGPVTGRMVVHHCANGLLVDDSYNANPGSVLAAGQWLATQPAPRLFVFGGVGELGQQSEALHQQMGRELAELDLQQLVTVGQLPAAALRGFGAAATGVDDYAAAVTITKDVLQAGGSVLVKGSRSAAMEKVVETLLQDTSLTNEEVH